MFVARPIELAEPEPNPFAARVVGPLVVPGQCGVHLHKRIDGVETSLAEAQTFNMVPPTPANRPNAADFEIAFLVASTSASEFSLPFFSRVTLRNAYKQLTGYGFRVTLTKVRVA